MVGFGVVEVFGVVDVFVFLFGAVDVCVADVCVADVCVADVFRILGVFGVVGGVIAGVESSSSPNNRHNQQGRPAKSIS